MNKLRLCETKKLHYGKYLYKLAISNPFAPWFRNEFQKGSLKLIKSKIEEYQVLHDIGQPMYKSVYRSERPISSDEFLDAKDLFKALENVDDYKIRVERWSGLCLYSNDKDFLKGIVNKSRVSVLEFWEPDTESIDALLSDKNIILVNKEPVHPLKITFNYKRVDPSFASWLEANQDKSTVGKATLENIKSGYASGNYIFVRDERVLTMVQMIVGHNIQRIERMVYKQNIDK